MLPRPALIRTVDRGRKVVGGGQEDTVSVPGTGSSVQRNTRVLGCGRLGGRPRRMDLGWSRDQVPKKWGRSGIMGAGQEALGIYQRRSDEDQLCWHKDHPSSSGGRWGWGQ